MTQFDICHTLIGAAFEVHNVLGTGFLEKVYQQALVVELQKRGLPAEFEKRIEVYYKRQVVGYYYADVLVSNSIIVETKCVERIVKPHIKQVKNYLKATNLPFAFILNFKPASLEFIKVFE